MSAVGAKVAVNGHLSFVYSLYDVGNDPVVQAIRLNMSNVASHAASFYREVAQTRKIWSIKDANGYPAPLNSDGKRAMPFWSSLRRAEKIVKTVSAYSGFEPIVIEWDVFCERWVPGLSKDGFLAGLNWSGITASGYDIEPIQLKKNVEAMVKAHSE